MIYKTPEIDCRLKLYEKFLPDVIIGKIRGGTFWHFSIIIDGKIIVNDYTLYLDREETAKEGLSMGRRLKAEYLAKLELDRVGDRLYIKETVPGQYQVYHRGKPISIATYSLEGAFGALRREKMQRKALKEWKADSGF